MKLRQFLFLRIHRFYIIALHYIESFTNEHVTIHHKILTINRSYKKHVLNTLEKYYTFIFDHSAEKTDNIYDNLCNENKRTDNMIGYLMLMTYLILWFAMERKQGIDLMLK